MDMIGDISHHLSRVRAPRRSPSEPPATLGPGMLSRETPVTV
jgi:hypothetical protein